MTADVTLLDATALAAKLRARELSCVEVMTAYLDAIERRNPRVNAIVSLRPRDALLAEARERDRGPVLGPLHGFPLAVKDLLPVTGLPLTKGSPILARDIAAHDAIIVERMKRAGGIVIGKTNTPEFGLGSHTYNTVFGTTGNPYDPSKTAGGSSGGAAAALAMRLLPVADGSDYGGSLRNPAAYCNVFGFRPSFGRIPSEPGDVFMPTISVLGPMARSVPDLALLFGVIAGYDRRAPLSMTDDPAVLAAPLAGEVRGKRIGWLGDLGGYLPFEPGILDLCREALRVFESLGCIVEEALPDYPPARVWEHFLTLRAFHAGFGILEFYRDPAKRAQMKPEAVSEVERGLRLGAYEVAQASAGRTLWYQSICRLFARFDCLVLPAAQVFPFDAAQAWPRTVAGRAMDSYHRWMETAILVSLSGCPALSVPIGFGAGGLPMGMQLVTANHEERLGLELAHAYDQATRWVATRPPADLG
jgi:amidase